MQNSGQRIIITIISFFIFAKVERILLYHNPSVRHKRKTKKNKPTQYLVAKGLHPHKKVINKTEEHMKLINLAFQGITANNENYDFGNKIYGVSALATVDKDAIKQGAMFVLYGEADYKNLDLPISAELKFADEDEEFILTRKVEENTNGEVVESAEVTKAGVVVASGKEAVDAFVAEHVGLNAKAFSALFAIEREENQLLAGDTITRETFVAEKMSELTTSEEVMEKVASFKEEEKAILAYIDSIKPISKVEIRDQQIVVDSRRIVLDGIREEIDKISQEVGFAEKYQEEQALYYDAIAKLEALNARSEEMTALANRASLSNEAQAIAGIYQSYEETKARLAGVRKGLAEEKKKVDALKAKVEEGKKSLAGITDEYAKSAIKSEEYHEKLKELVMLGSTEPQALRLKESVESYYKVFDAQIAGVEERKAVLEEQYLALNAACIELTQKKQAIRDAVDYKKAVQRGAVLEVDVVSSEAQLVALEEKVEELGKERAKLFEKKMDATELASELRTKRANLDKAVRGKNADAKTALNNASLYSHTLYNKHLAVSNYEVEIAAIEKKIEEVKLAQATYGEKRDRLLVRKQEVSAHREKLIAKLDLFNEKLTEYESHNRMSDLADDVEYGERCPICDGFVTLKKAIPLRDSRAIVDQIDALKAEIEKDTNALIAAESSIGQFDAATTISSQYLVALEESKAQKEVLMDGILREYGVNSVAELFAKAEGAVESYNRKVLNYDALRATLYDLDQQESIIVECNAKIAKIDNELLPTAVQQQAEIEAKVADIKAEYENLATTYFAGESARDLLLKLQVVEKEYETLEKELEEKEDKLREVIAERDDLQKATMAYVARTIPVVINGKEYSYQDVVAKVYSDNVRALIAEIQDADDKKSSTKVKLMGVKTVVDRMEKESEEVERAFIASVAKADAMEESAMGVFAEYEGKFQELGINSSRDLERLILDEATIARYSAELIAYDEELVGTKEAINVYQSGITAHAGYYDNYESNVKALAELKEKEEVAIIDLGNSMADIKEMQERYEALSLANKKLVKIQEKITDFEGISVAVKEGAIIAKDIAQVVIERANGIIKTISGGRYFIETAEDGTVILNSQKGKVRTDKLTREEKILLPLGLAGAFNEVMLKLLAGDIVPVISIGASENDKASLTPIFEYSKDREMIAIPEDESAFFRALSRIE